MKIAVLVKQVPDTTEMQVDKNTGTLIRTGVPTITNPDDLAGVEAVLRLKDKNPNIEITVISMGPPQAVSMLRELYAMGVDHCALITDRAFAGSDTWATSNVLARALEGKGYDLIVCGRQAIDGDTAQVGPQVAAKMELPQVTYVQDVKEMTSDKIVVIKALEDRMETIEMKLPGVITMLATAIKPRYMNIGGIFEAFDKEVKWVTNAELNLTKEEVGLTGSPTKVFRSFANQRSSEIEVLKIDASEAKNRIVSVLSEQNFI
ncbi:electron transfer flavoprotein subunit beta/FixA family protein [Proteiniclasticum sp. QWL-01]|uniref:electron transfer flavoprotein subunit beta/FixA family protein n=1 Tax=Proteiniclasticum sp. QWL-01 TaxID=3036945 RepID=UPI0024117BC1|nr:electron transfer flavoprotein subunit beta/FixA family protein [Proteiniclasticum sp. QWL-01]WFF73720.1 electron transfer flavoprotein subunit beta/FixA family protein [Proteiniclasticum sp. QWL-01]